MSLSLAESLLVAPRLAAPAAARRKLSALAAGADASALVPALQRNAVRDLLLGLADHSPYLWTLVAENPARLAGILARPPRGSLDAVVAALAARRDDDEAELMRALRRLKREAALIIALADLGGVWDVTEATAALTLFADAALSAALGFLLRRTRHGGRLALDPDAPDPQTGSGLVVLALGKHGAFELNYSSDVDLIVFYEPERVALSHGVEPRAVRRAHRPRRSPGSCRSAPATVTSSASTCACGPIPAPRRSPLSYQRRSTTTRASARTGSARP